ncbi:P-loop containing nucleoside triphosphate hydrolases superfamily protein [Raphanus sativus]|uniref:GTP-binding protein At2g22870-like n=1 Tax=Raphanus sativus TaxID=3726 RepID=A0A9W3DCA9_RAPSA|nr:GTP-binding protein At2g22870-like [Raphanus sativus]KAJ4908533.1 P-loop containing nucleoside triphosphate hydrolases superfamily protein [Raphanus sativus]
MVLAQLPRFHLSIFAKSHFSLASSHFINPNPPVKLARTLFSLPPRSNLATVEPTPASSDLEDAPVEISLDRLFIPPETDISGEDPSRLAARILKGSNIVLSRYARDAQVVQADYVKSSVRTEDCPADGLPEFALVGRSNVGKSSLLNSLVKRKRLALTSKKPGKTQCINHFRINDNWYLVDLPGYGYATAPHELKKDWNKFTKDYFLNRSTLVSVFLLVDASIPPKQIDLDYASWLGQNQVPMTMVFTKCDKRKKKKNGGKRPEENIKEFQDLIQGFFETTPPWIMTSSVTNQGRDEILLHMAQLRNYWLKH